MRFNPDDYVDVQERIVRPKRRRVYAPSHPQANKGGWVYRYRLVAEKMLGRQLLRGEVVHHLDGDESNDDPANLVVFGSNGEHLSAELSIDGWARDHDVCVDCGESVRPHVAQGRCTRCYQRKKKGSHPYRPGAWSQAVDGCRECGTSERPHLSLGLCGACYRRSRRKAGLS